MAFGDVVDPLGWDGHLLLLCETEPERRAGLATWVRRGLEREEKILYTETGDEPPERSVLGVLSTHGLDVDAATAEGLLQVVPLPEFYPSGFRPMAERALADGFPAVRISAEAGVVLTLLSEQAYADVENALDELCHTHPVSALCQYDAAPVPHRATSVHARGIRGRQLQTGRSDEGLILGGEIDHFDGALLTEVLRATTSERVGPFHLDLSRVTFLGSAGVRALLDGTEQFRDQGGRVLLLAPQPIVGRVLAILGIDQFPNLELTGRTGRDTGDI
jgi:anti-anti-sigma factor